jgi:lysophospholipase L1-like esterase
MANFLFGSSNIYRNFARAVSSGCFSGRDMQLVQCTKKTVLDASLATMTSATLVITSVLENFITEVCLGVPDDEIQHFAHQQITAHVDALLDLSNRLPDVVILIVPPSYRSSPVWFGSYLPDFLGFLAAEVARVDSNRVGICSPFVVVPSLLEQDGVHLTPAGGDRFLSHIDSELKLLIVDAPVVQVGDIDGPVQDQPAAELRLSQVVGAVNRGTCLTEAVNGLCRSTSVFEAFVRRRFRDDDFIFSRMKEESDAELNRSREDRVVITGLPGPALPTSTHAEKKKHYSEVITRLITLACVSADPQPKVLYLRSLMSVYCR